MHVHSAIDNGAEKIATRAVVEDEIQIVIFFYNVVELDDVIVM